MMLAQTAVTLDFSSIASWAFLSALALIVFFLRGIYQDFKKVVDRVDGHHVEIVVLKQEVASVRAECTATKARLYDIEKAFGFSLKDGTND